MGRRQAADLHSTLTAFVTPASWGHVKAWAKLTPTFPSHSSHFHLGYLAAPLLTAPVPCCPSIQTAEQQAPGSHAPCWGHRLLFCLSLLAHTHRTH